MRRSIQLGAAVVVGAGALLAGCASSAQEPATTKPAAIAAASSAAASSAVPSPTWTAKLSNEPFTTEEVDAARAKQPAAAKKHTEAGAQAYGRYFLETAYESWRVADPALMDGLYMPECKICQMFQANGADLQARNQHYDSTPVEVERVDSAVGSTDDVRLLVATTHQLEANVVTADGTVVEEVKPETAQILMGLAWDGTGWTVALAQFANAAGSGTAPASP